MKLAKRAIFLVGLYKVSFPLVEFTRSYYNIHFNPSTVGEHNYKRLQERYYTQGIDSKQNKPYALVTGASEGIGREIALELALSGFNLVLASRSMEKMQFARDYIMKQLKEPIQIDLISIDLSTGNTEQIEQLFKEATINVDGTQRNLKILVNNAGIAKRSPFFDLDPQMIQDMIIVNLYGQTFLTKHYLNYIKQRKDLLEKQKMFQTSDRFAVIHLSSFVSEFRMQNNAVYSATKIYNKIFGHMTGFQASMGNRFNQRRYGQVQSQLDTIIVKPAYVTTAMTGYKKGRFAVEPQETAQGIFRNLGSLYQTYGASPHNLLGYTFMYFPPFVIHQMMLKKPLSIKSQPKSNPPQEN
eukprot:403343456